MGVDKVSDCVSQSCVNISPLSRWSIGGTGGVLVIAAIALPIIAFVSPEWFMSSIGRLGNSPPWALCIIPSLTVIGVGGSLIIFAVHSGPKQQRIETSHSLLESTNRNIAVKDQAQQTELNTDRKEDSPLSVALKDPIYNQSTEPTGVDIKGTIYVKLDNSSKPAPIRRDGRFQYSKNLSTKDKEPITIDQNDIYIPLSGYFEQSNLEELPNFFFKNTHNSEYENTISLFLPYSLLKGADDDQTISFYYQDRLIELRCNQSISPYEHKNVPPLSFKKSIMAMIYRSKKDQIQFLFKEDVIPDVDLPRFKTFLFGTSLTQWNHDGTQTPMTDFSFYKIDEYDNGPYKQIDEIPCIWQSKEKSRFFYFSQDLEVPISDIHMIETRGFSTLHQLWLIIPHRPEFNKEGPHLQGWAHKDRVHSSAYGGMTISPAPARQKGDRSTGYNYGMYCKIDLNEHDSNFSLGFCQNGWLCLKYLGGLVISELTEEEFSMLSPAKIPYSD